MLGFDVDDVFGALIRQLTQFDECLGVNLIFLHFMAVTPPCRRAAVPRAAVPRAAVNINRRHISQHACIGLHAAETCFIAHPDHTA